MTFPSHVKIVEVGARDGLQNESVALSVEDRVSLIEQLANAGLPVIEAGSFVSPKWVPQMAGSDQVLQQVRVPDHISLPVLVPNLKGLELALSSGAKEIAIFGAASEGFSRKNINCSVAESLDRFRPVTEQAQAAGIKVRGYVSCVLDCPYDGPTAPEKVLEVARAMREMGCYEISLGDTIGTGTPGRVQALIRQCAAEIPVDHLAVHFHDSWGQALANIYAALECGISVIDASVSGLGGCPYAAGASGNVATEDVVYMLNGMGVETGIDFNALLAAGWSISDRLGRPPASRASLAARAGRQGQN